MFKLTIALPDEIVYEGEAEILNVYTRNGQIGVLENHSPFVDIIRACEMTFKDDKGIVNKLAVSGGWLFVWNTEVTVFVDSSEFDYEIDLEEAMKDKEEVEKELLEFSDGDVIRRAQMNAKLEKAVNRIDLAQKTTKKI